MQKERFQLRDVFNLDTIKYISLNIKSTYPLFDQEGFEEDCSKNFLDLDFMQRCMKIENNLEIFLPKSFKQSTKIILDSLGDEIKNDVLEGYDGFYIMPLTLYISKNGLDDLDTSFNALKEMTKRFTSEFAMREFLIKHQDKSMQFLQQCSIDKNVHIRRLASEGSRPRLPLAVALKEFKKDSSKVLELLKLLKGEKSLLVVRSIANNLNDISKDNPEDMLNFLKTFKVSKNHQDYFIKHALRTLVKTANKDALAMLGYKNDINIDTKLTLKSKTITLGENLEFDVYIKNNQDKNINLMIDYLIYFKKANGSNKEKVFKLSKKVIASNSTLRLEKKHLIKSATTRKHYKGEHFLQIQINGLLQKEKLKFNLNFK